jgi:Protein of unknown function (DUF2911)
MKPAKKLIRKPIFVGHITRHFQDHMKKTLIITSVVIFIFLIVIGYFRFYVKSFSPESEVTYNENGYHVTIRYCRPYKKGRVIFGGLVPYSKIWRTGANEATTFTTETDLKFGSKILKAGTYSLWTMPGEQTWNIIFNSEYGQWGINFNGEANKDAKDDVLSVEVPVVLQDKSFEQFTIDVKKVGEEMEMIFEWDKTLVPVPFSK